MGSGEARPVEPTHRLPSAAAGCGGGETPRAVPVAARAAHVPPRPPARGPRAARAGACRGSSAGIGGVSARLWRQGHLAAWRSRAAPGPTRGELCAAGAQRDEGREPRGVPWSRWCRGNSGQGPDWVQTGAGRGPDSGRTGAGRPWRRGDPASCEPASWAPALRGCWCGHRGSNPDSLPGNGFSHHFGFRRRPGLRPRRSWSGLSLQPGRPEAAVAAARLVSTPSPALSGAGLGSGSPPAPPVRIPRI